MGFCRRCGEIVTGTRCNCGGTAVAPVVPWSQSTSEDKTSDKWSKTYIHRERSVSPTRPLTTSLTGSIPSAPAKRFPRPASNSIVSSPILGSRVSAHIASTTSQNRPPSFLKYSSTLPDPDSGILPSLDHHDATLSKVYGSILQPKESLTTHSCAICFSTFPPDATIYPDPTVANSSRFLCRPCFTTNGGSKGPCSACSRPVLILRSEGGFIEAAGKYWHKRCFNCSGCSKNIGDSPMLDLFGNPSCIECFDNCLVRGLNTPKKYSPSDGRDMKVNNIGGMNFHSDGKKSREGSPVVEELEQRLGITKSREGSPALEELSQRHGMIGKKSPTRYSASGSSAGKPLASSQESTLVERLRSKRNSQINETAARSPVRGQTTGSSAPTQKAAEEMKQRFLKYSSSPRTPTPTDCDPLSTPCFSPRSSTHSRARSSSNNSTSLFEKAPASPLSPTFPQTPDLMSDFSDATTQSSFSGLDSPPRDDKDFDEPFRIPGFEQASHYVPRDVFRTPDRLAEGMPNAMRSPKHTPTSFKSASSPSKISISALDSNRYSSVKPKSVQSLDEITIPPLTPAELMASARCVNCGGSVFSVRGGSKFVTVPNDGDGTQALTYHADCFRCVECNGIFKQTKISQAVFVKSKKGPCHVECAPATMITFRKSPSLGSLRSSPSDGNTKATSGAAVLPPISPLAHASSSRMDKPSIVAQTSPGSSVPRFGSRTTCPGCHQSVSPMERGVVPGPQGTRWHTGCLVCGGKNATKGSSGQARGKKKGEPGCGKRLDSAAKSSEDGGVWCRECLLLLGETRAVTSQMPLVPAHAWSAKVTAQLTGTTTIARQFTGMGSDSGPLRQMVGGGLNPTRSISPTKQLGMFGGSGMRPRPKSVIGMRNTKSIDEGRGMFLVRQLTGASGV